jgi:PKD repeat protein
MWAWTLEMRNRHGGNPTHTYQSPGTYTVKLTASSQTEGQAQRSKKGYITVSQAGTGPKAAFTVDKRSGPKPLTVTFTDQSTGNPTMWAWNFGDGGTDMVANPTHTYQEAGVYTISLTVSNMAGSDTKTEKDYISLLETSHPPVAMFEATPTYWHSSSDRHIHRLSTRAANLISWDFGDGTTSCEANPTHVLQSTGSYTITLT